MEFDLTFLAVLLVPGGLRFVINAIRRLVRRRVSALEGFHKDLTETTRTVRRALLFRGVCTVVILLVVAAVFFSLPDGPIGYGLGLALAVSAVHASNWTATAAMVLQMRMADGQAASFLNPLSSLASLGRLEIAPQIKKDFRVQQLLFWLGVAALGQALVAGLLRRATIPVGLGSDGWRFSDLPVPWTVYSLGTGAAGLALLAFQSSLTRQQRLARLVKGAASRNDFDVLFLRSFGSELEQVPCAQPMPDDVIEQWLIPRFSVPLETALLRLLWPIGDVGMVLEPGEQRSRKSAMAVGMSLDAERPWFPQVEDLAARAKLIVLVMGDRPGLQAELALIDSLGDLARKTILVMPPSRRKLLERQELTESVAEVDKSLLAGRYLLGFVRGTEAWNAVWADDFCDLDYSVLLDAALRSYDVEYP